MRTPKVEDIQISCHCPNRQASYSLILLQTHPNMPFIQDGSWNTPAKTSENIPISPLTADSVPVGCGRIIPHPTSSLVRQPATPKKGNCTSQYRVDVQVKYPTVSALNYHKIEQSPTYPSCNDIGKHTQSNCDARRTVTTGKTSERRA